MLFSCQIINTGKTVGDDGRAELLGTLYAKPRLVVYFQNSEQIAALYMQMQLNGSCRFKSHPQLLCISSPHYCL